MNLQQRDKRALLLLALAAVIAVVLHFSLSQDSQPAVVAASGSIQSAEHRLARLRQLVSTVPGKQEVLKKVSAELAEREKKLIQAETAAQAQAQLLETLRRLAKAQAEPIDLRNLEPRQVRPYGEDYGEVVVGATFEGHIEQLVQLLADITADPQMIAVEDLRVSAQNQKQKTVLARLSLSGIVPKRLVPEKKGFGSF